MLLGQACQGLFLAQIERNQTRSTNCIRIQCKYVQVFFFKLRKAPLHLAPCLPCSCSPNSLEGGSLVACHFGQTLLEVCTPKTNQHILMHKFAASVHHQCCCSTWCLQAVYHLLSYPSPLTCKPQEACRKHLCLAQKSTPTSPDHAECAPQELMKSRLFFLSAPWLMTVLLCI